MSHYNFLNIGVWNIHGLFSRVNNSKLCKLEETVFLEKIKKIEILCLQETQCGISETTSLSLEGYRLIPFERNKSGNNRYFGGPLLLIKRGIRKGIKILDSVNGDIIWIKLQKDFFGLENDLFVCFVYASPLNSCYTKNLDYDIFDLVEGGISKYNKEGDVILAGDLNAKTNTENDFVSDIQDDHSPINNINIYSYDLPMERENVDKHPVDAQGHKFLQLCKNSNLRILNGRCCGDRLGNLTRFPMALRESPSTLDYMATNPQLMKKVRLMTVLPHYGLSDHNCLCLSLKTKFSVDAVSTDVIINKSARMNYSSSCEFLRKLCSPRGREKITAFFENCRDENKVSIDMIYSEFVEIFTFCATNSSAALSKKKRKRTSKKTKSWYTSECKILKSALNRAEKNYRKEPFNRGLLQKLIKAKKEFKSKYKESEKMLRNSMCDKLLSISDKNPTEFWNLIKKMRKWGSPVNEPADTIHPSEWLSHFKSLLNEGPKTPQNLLQELESLESEPFYSELDFRISRQEIDSAFKKLNKNASEGPDRVSGIGYRVSGIG